MQRFAVWTIWALKLADPSITTAQSCFDILPILELPRAGGAAVRVADVDGDGEQDLIATTIDGILSVALGNGDGTFGAFTETEIAPVPSKIRTGDFNGDGRLDTAIVRNEYGVPGSNLTLLLGDGTGGRDSSTSSCWAGRPDVSELDCIRLR